MHELIWLPASTRMYSYCRASSRNSSSIGAAVGGARPVELIGAGEDLEARLVLHHQLAQELAIEAVQVVDRVEQAVAGPHAEEQRDLAEPGLQIDDDRRSLAQARELDAAVHRHRRRAGAALGAEEHQRRRRRPRALRGLAARRRPAHRAVERFLGGRPGEELVGAGAHRLQDQVGIGGRARRRRCRRRRAPARSRSMLDIADDGVAARVDDDEVRRRRRRAPARSSMTLTGIAPARSSRPMCFLNASSSVTMSPTSCAMATSDSARARPGTGHRPALVLAAASSSDFW